VKIVINKCFGGFGLSNKALSAWAASKNRECYFFESDYQGSYIRTNVPGESMFTFAFDAPEVPNDVNLTQVERRDWFEEHMIYDRTIDRTDPDLIRIVEEMGSDAASSRLADLRIIEIPDGTEYTIEEYDGREHIAERHRTWY
jgi:hypothetical protein